MEILKHFKYWHACIWPLDEKTPSTVDNAPLTTNLIGSASTSSTTKMGIKSTILLLLISLVYLISSVAAGWSCTYPISSQSDSLSQHI